PGGAQFQQRLGRGTVAVMHSDGEAAAHQARGEMLAEMAEADEGITHSVVSQRNSDHLRPSSRGLVPGSTPFYRAAPKAWIPRPSRGMTSESGLRLRSRPAAEAALGRVIDRRGLHLEMQLVAGIGVRLRRLFVQLDAEAGRVGDDDIAVLPLDRLLQELGME